MSSGFSPIAGNGFSGRTDVVRALFSIWEPLQAAFSKDGATVQIDHSGAIFDRAAISLEGFARPLWGIVPYVMGGGEFDNWDLFNRGLSNGTDPDHPEYWGDITDIDQRQVELAAIGFALAVVPEHFWEPLTEEAKKNVIRYLLMGREHDLPECNWHFFRVLMDLGLNRAGAVYDQAKLSNESFDKIDRYYIEDGWYRDGDPKGELYRMDYYNPFAMHLYGLLYSALQPNDTERVEKYRSRAREFTKEFVNFFADDGSSVPYGRSLTYRFACGSFWGALAFADEEALPWGVIKGLYLRHLRWWSQQPISSLNSNILSVGYCYPNTFFSEGYNSACSPYWAMKAFLPLALPESHPFWSSKEVDLDHVKVPFVSSVPGFVFSHNPKNTVMLVSGPERKDMRFVTEKYNKFAYSSRYGFSIEADYERFYAGVFDNMLAFSDDGAHFRVRERCAVAKVSGTILYSLWNPWSDVKVETWLIPCGPWHTRVHKIVSPRKLSTIEGGFCVPLADFNKDLRFQKENYALVQAEEDISCITELSDTKRTGRVHKPEGNTNLMFSRTLVPQLLADIEPNKEHIFVTAVLASPDKLAAQTALKNPPPVPDIKQLVELAGKADLVGIMK
ncbi:hypothetical protein AWJ20_5156 [Sugiyamaella lignohabitans]|uniref:DUF2264 domain-containing protein n=1 Tax=Sugiyamaella lignohabitans TaxID=796027 RepID=A0A167EKV4_9ASCO|nr:uncharacterized protein AWJ20_5156 [Sugiyamaella lignohabitans]ANB14195.1 hypothetical protein AWJ20_5156 [Sugiyamaella lignohabitans]